MRDIHAGVGGESRGLNGRIHGIFVWYYVIQDHWRDFILFLGRVADVWLGGHNHATGICELNNVESAL